ncbi:hypothetical protein JG688_00005070 [Phytophthora aleatoria]|uniref:Axonemal Inner Arm I1 Intermediate Chain Dynein n=1 Tax=Phytophthora aleatoria TaxID=2496075 RepID=A0A8J5J9X8_9STRA|nr:hypothetical protein JG688_00005070 [Phytophthora aleatoria]
MASPSSARVSVGSSTKQIHGSKRDATARSRIIGASTVSNSSRRVNGSVANVNGGAGHSSGHSTRVYLDGQDVTPQSLLVSRIKSTTEPKGRGKGGRGTRSKAHAIGASTAGASMAGASFLFSTASTSSADNDSDNESSSSIVGTAVKAPRKEPKPNVGDHPTANSMAPSSNQEEDENTRLAATAGPTDTEDHEEGKDEAGDPLTGLGPDQDAPLLVGRKSMTVSNGLSPGLRRPVTVRLGETATEMLYELRSVCVALDAPDHNAVAARNNRYQAICAQKKGSDKYVQGRTQTLQLAQKAKEVMTAPPATRDAACVATDWDIYDCGKLEEETNAEDEVGGAIPNGATQAQTTSSEGSSKVAEGTPASTGTEPIATAYVSGNSNASVVPGDQSGGNISAGASQDFAGLTGAEGASSGSAATNSQVGMSVANASRGVLSGAAVGSGDQRANNVYARANTNVDLGEIIARQRTSHVLGSSSLTLMASIVERAVQQNVYHEQHVRYRDYPMLETAETVTEPPNVIVPALDMGFPGSVGSGRGPGTAAAGTNGVGGGTDGVISRQASGRSLAFASQGDPSVYYVGTEDGLVHKCSVSYNEQYLQTYIGHTGPVYQLLVSPFCSDLFLSCSGDWSLKLWHQADTHGEATLTFHSVDLAKAVLGASWSPSDAGVFAAVAEDGRIELWDLIQSTLDPIVRHFPKKYISVPVPVAQPVEGDGLDSSSRDLTPKEGDNDETYRDPNAVEIPATTMVEVPLECTTVAFAPKAPVLIVGDSTGDVTVYRVPAQVSKSATCNGETSDAASYIEDQAARLLRTIRSNKHE